LWSILIRLWAQGHATDSLIFIMELNLSLDAIRHIRKFDGTKFQNWEHSMEILFEFKEVKDIVDVSIVHYGDNLKKTLMANDYMYFSILTG